MDYFVHGLFRDEENAARAVQTLVDAHFNPDLISALMHLEGDVEVVDAVPVFKVGSSRGATLGSALGMIGGALLASGGLLAGGPLLAAAAGGATGALAGALGGLGRWKDEIDFPEDVHAGMILVGVSTEEASIETARVALAIAHPDRIHVSRKNEACTEVETGVLSETGVLARQSNVVPDRETRAEPDLRTLLREDHSRLDDLFEKVLTAFEADAQDETARLWTAFERGLRAHFELEELHILPELAKVDAAESAALLAEHTQLRSKLGELGVGVDLHLTRQGAVADFIAALQAHAAREDALMYRFAQTGMPERTRATLRSRLPAPRVL